MWFGRVISIVLSMHVAIAIWVVLMMLLPGHSGWSVEQIIRILP